MSTLEADAGEPVSFVSDTYPARIVFWEGRRSVGSPPRNGTLRRPDRGNHTESHLTPCSCMMNPRTSASPRLKVAVCSGRPGVSDESIWPDMRTIVNTYQINLVTIARDVRKSTEKRANIARPFAEPHVAVRRVKRARRMGAFSLRLGGFGTYRRGHLPVGHAHRCLAHPAKVRRVRSPGPSCGGAGVPWATATLTTRAGFRGGLL